MSYLALVLCALLAGFALWDMICNEKTYRQRRAIVDRIFAGNNDWVALTKAYHAVSYHDHRRALVRFRDPLKLYPASLQDFING